MSTRLRVQRDYTDNVKLPEHNTRINIQDPVGASSAAAIIKANRTGNYENVGNALVVASSVTIDDGTQEEPTVVTTVEATVLGKENHDDVTLRDPKMVEQFRSDGWNIKGTTTVNIMG